jgi:hypothetical protein
MAQTKFSAGQRVLAARGGVGAPAGRFQIVSVLPRDSGAQRYRVRGEAESFERVIDEARLEAVSYD